MNKGKEVSASREGMQHLHSVIGFIQMLKLMQEFAPLVPRDELAKLFCEPFEKTNLTREQFAWLLKNATYADEPTTHL